MKTLIIAEAGVNHNGSIERALELVDCAAQAGADVVKFQTFKSASVISAAAPKAAYQKATTGEVESQLDMVRKLELDEAAHLRIVERCAQRGIAFLSTPFDLESARFLCDDLRMPRLKIPSGEITNAPFLLALARYRLPVILSTGMSTLGEVEMALAILAYGFIGAQDAPGPEAFLKAYVSPEGGRALAERVTLLHCTTEYPAAMEDVNLRAMDTLASAFGLPVGFSDHSRGVVAPIAATARGACVIEKHFTLDKSLPGPDHAASLDPTELRLMVEGVRQTEAALGSPRKIYGVAEGANRPVARRSLVAVRDVRAGEVWTQDNLTCKRPGGGLSPFAYWSLLGQPAERDHHADEVLSRRDPR